jgi:hypothetical protein
MISPGTENNKCPGDHVLMVSVGFLAGNHHFNHLFTGPYDWYLPVIWSGYRFWLSHAVAKTGDHQFWYLSHQDPELVATSSDNCPTSAPGWFGTSSITWYL